MTVDKMLQKIYDSEINIKIEWFWDAGVEITVGDALNGYGDTYCANSVRDAVGFIYNKLDAEGRII